MVSKSSLVAAITLALLIFTQQGAYTLAASVVAPELTGASTVEGGDPDLAEAISTDTDELAQNFFVPAVAPHQRWLSVGALADNAYAAQFYARDTFESARGFVFAGERFRKDLEDAIDWFGSQQTPDGFIPLWFRETSGLNTYVYCPYQRQGSDSGGVRQYDHVAKFIDAVLTAYRWNGDQKWLVQHAPQAQLAWRWLNNSTDTTGLIQATATQYCGADWADAVVRGGYATFVEVDYYQATKSMSAIATSMGDAKMAAFYDQRAREIRDEINTMLWRVSIPHGYDGPAFGHYVGWIDSTGVHDYFEVDSNAYAIGSGVAPDDRSAEIAHFLVQHWSYLVNASGATRILYGLYEPQDLTINASRAAEVYVNGGYWFGVSMYLADALRQLRMTPQLWDLERKVVHATVAAGPDGLYEWYHADGTPALNHLQSWSMGFPLLLIYGDIVGVSPEAGSIVASPCLDQGLGMLTISLSYRGHLTQLKAEPGCSGAPGNGSLLGK